MNIVAVLLVFLSGQQKHFMDCDAPEPYDRMTGSDLDHQTMKTGSTLDIPKAGLTRGGTMG